MSWQCPNAIQMKTIKGLGCKYLMKKNEVYDTPQKEAMIYCACQRYCPTERRVVNSDGARKCYDIHKQ